MISPRQTVKKRMYTQTLQTTHWLQSDPSHLKYCTLSLGVKIFWSVYILDSYNRHTHTDTHVRTRTHSCHLLPVTLNANRGGGWQRDEVVIQGPNQRCTKVTKYTQQPCQRWSKNRQREAEKEESSMQGKKTAVVSKCLILACLF